MLCPCTSNAYICSVQRVSFLFYLMKTNPQTHINSNALPENLSTFLYPIAVALQSSFMHSQSVTKQVRQWLCDAKRNYIYDHPEVRLFSSLQQLQVRGQ